MDFRGVPPMQMNGNLTENWKFWRQRFLTYLTATEISKKEGATKCAQLLTLIGDEGIRIFNTFVIPDEQKDNLEFLISQFDNYFNPRKNLAFERHKFLSCKQKEFQTIEHYVTELKNLAMSCELGQLQDSLTKDILICGIRCEMLREKLLEKDVDSMDEAVRICINSENTKERNRQITNGNSSREAEVNAVRRHHFPSKMKVAARAPARPRRGTQTQATAPPCNKCSYQHADQKCPARGKKCGTCGKLNHFSSVCQNRRSGEPSFNKKQTGRNFNHYSYDNNCNGGRVVHEINEDECNVDNNFLFIGSI